VVKEEFDDDDEDQIADSAAIDGIEDMDLDTRGKYDRQKTKDIGFELPIDDDDDEGIDDNIDDDYLDDDIEDEEAAVIG